jgi:RNA polymerase sigma factor (TIGR02999 family)
MSTHVSEITALLERAVGDPRARETLFRLIEQRFREIAGALLRKEGQAGSWQETMLVDDAFCNLIAANSDQWQNREQFFCSAAKVMRRLLVDHARERKALKRGGGAVVAGLDEQRHTPRPGTPGPADLVELNDILEKLETQHPDVFRVFELHYFMGCELKEIADEILCIPYTTVKRRWSEAKRRLYEELTRER